MRDQQVNGEVEEKKVEKIVAGEVYRRKKSLGKRFKETFVGGDARSVWDYVIFDVIIPAAKDMFADAVSQGFERMIYGEGRSARRRPSSRVSGTSGYVSYDRFSSSSRREESRPLSRRGRATHDFDEIVLATRAEAEDVIERLFDLVSKYEQATLSDLYSLVGVSSDYTDERYGWRDIRGAGVTRISNGYLLDLPRPEPLN